MTENDTSVLRNLRDLAGGHWVRPIDIGSNGQSAIPSTLARLVKAGLAEQRATAQTYALYRITEAGRAALAQRHGDGPRRTAETYRIGQLVFLFYDGRFAAVALRLADVHSRRGRRACGISRSWHIDAQPDFAKLFPQGHLDQI